MADDESREESIGEGGEPAPLGDLADRIRSRRSSADAGVSESASGDANAATLDDLFEEATFEPIESDELWDALDQESTPGMGVESAEAPDEHVVPKRSYCENCEYFSEPPEIHCTHAGTTIVEYVDLGHIRVRNCPIVDQRRELGERESVEESQR